MPGVLGPVKERRPYLWCLKSSILTDEIEDWYETKIFQKEKEPLLKIKYYAILSVALSVLVCPASATSLNDLFDKSKPFSRTQDNSPLCLYWQDQRFKVRDVKTKKDLGSVETDLDSKRQLVEIRLVTLQDPSHAPEVFKTLSGIFKASKAKLPPQICHLGYLCLKDDTKLLDAALADGFQETFLYSVNPSYKYLLKEIPFKNEEVHPTPLFSLETNHKATSATSLEKSLFPKASQPLVVNKKYCSKTGPALYLTYSESIDIEKAVKISMIAKGFRLFKRTGDHEIGFLAFNYVPEEKTVRLGALWIEVPARKQTYGFQAVNSFVALCMAKKDLFPLAEHVSFLTTQDNQAMIALGKKAGFLQKVASNQPASTSGFAGFEFFLHKLFNDLE